jgi:hypothetical protein
MKTRTFVCRPKLLEFFSTMHDVVCFKRKRATFVPVLEWLEDRVTPSHLRLGLYEHGLGLEGVFGNPFDNLLGEAHEAPPPHAGGGSYHPAPESGGGGGGGGGGGAGQGDSGVSPFPKSLSL